MKLQLLEDMYEASARDEWEYFLAEDGTVVFQCEELGMWAKTIADADLGTVYTIFLHDGDIKFMNTGNCDNYEELIDFFDHIAPE
jgi:hypothetical protein